MKIVLELLVGFFYRAKTKVTSATFGPSPLQFLIAPWQRCDRSGFVLSTHPSMFGEHQESGRTAFLSAAQS